MIDNTITADTAKKLKKAFHETKELVLSALIDKLAEHILYSWQATISGNIMADATIGKSFSIILICHYFNEDFHRRLRLFNRDFNKFSDNEIIGLLAGQLKFLLDEHGFGHETLNADLKPDINGNNIKVKW